MKPDWGGRVAMEAGPRDNEETTVDDVRDGPRVRGAHGVPGEAPVRGVGGSASARAGGHHDDEGDGTVEETPEEPQELRPQRKLRLWQLAPIVILAALGSLMFAFPLAFEPSGGSGAVASMLGLLICGCAAGWGVMAARRVGHTWPGLPARGSGDRADWRVAALYALVVGTLVALAIWRVARLR